MSNPYDPGYSPYLPSNGGYGETPGSPFGTHPRPTPTDGISIAALVCSLTCCASPVGVGLGIAGIVRTKNGRRNGRWMAITGVVVGTLGTLVLAGTIAGFTWLGFNLYFEEDARVGDCVNTSSLFGENDLWQASCDEEHDGQVYAAGVFRDADGGAEAYADSRVAFCKDRLAEADEVWQRLVANGDHRVDGSTSAIDGESALPSDHWVCFVERTDGEQLDRDLSR